jgi:hypothetical protein
MSNIQIADQYAKNMSSILNAGGVWPHSIAALPKKEITGVLAAYRKHFSKVDYNSKTKLVVCYK